MSSSGGELRLRRIDLGEFESASRGLDLLVCQTPQWLDFLRPSQSAEPVAAEVLLADVPMGYFVGAIVRKAGLRILGSPLRGWTTSYMGFTFDSTGLDQAALLDALRNFAFKDLRCVHVEILDRTITIDVSRAGWSKTILHGYEIDLTLSEAQLFANMSSACRRCIRKAEGVGLRVVEANDPVGFSAEYYSQAREVFARKGLVPPFPEKRVEQLIEALQPSGMLLLLRALDRSGSCIASSLFPGHGRQMYFWGGASRTDGLLNRPNEAMMWHAMRLWKARGAQTFDLGGGGKYKEKYGGRAIIVPWLRCSSSPLIATLRRSAERVLRLKQRVHGGRR